jgi:hypothetical protein
LKGIDKVKTEEQMKVDNETNKKLVYGSFYLLGLGLVICATLYFIIT